MKRTPVEGAPRGQAWKENCQRKGGKKGGSVVVVWRLCHWDSIYKVLCVGQITQMSHMACCDSTAKAAPDRATDAKKNPLQSCDDWRLQLCFIVPVKLAGVSIWCGAELCDHVQNYHRGYCCWLAVRLSIEALKSFWSPLSCWKHRNRWTENRHIFGVFN